MGPKRAGLRCSEHPQRHVLVEQPRGVEVPQPHQQQVQQQQAQAEEAEHDLVAHVDRRLRQAHEEPQPRERAVEEPRRPPADQVIVEVDQDLRAEREGDPEDREEAEDLEQCLGVEDDRDREDDDRDEADVLERDVGAGAAGAQQLQQEAEHEEGHELHRGDRGRVEEAVGVVVLAL